MESGLLGEALTGELLENYVTRIPSARIFHSLAWPGSATADVDHAVLCGRRLMLIDSQRWEPRRIHLRLGRQHPAGRQAVPRLADPAAQRGRCLPAAIAPMSRARGRTHPPQPSGSRQHPGNPWPRMQALTAHGFLTHTCAWLADQPDVIDTRAVALLRSMINTPADVFEWKARR
ncbi:MAG: nuclease-related domain-containing protein [Pseudonocardiaceae bacterium]